MSSPTKFMVLPSKPNRALIHALTPSYIDENFQLMADSVSVWLRNPAARGNVEFCQSLFKTINTVILDNVYFQAVEQRAHLLTLLGHGQFALGMRVRLKYLTPLFSMWGLVPYEEQDEAEMAITQILLNWFLVVYRNSSNAINPVLLEISEAIYQYTPHRFVRGYQFEISHDLSPLFIYTDCIPEVAAVY